MSRQLRLWVPHIPYTLAQQFIRDRYRRILERRTWSGLRGESEYQLRASKQDGTVTVTFQSQTVTGAGTAFALGDIGRQFKAGSGSPIYSITNVVGQVLTLDRPFGNPSAAGLTYFVFDGYVNAPADFKSHIAVVDRLQGWRLRTWITQDELNAWDPQRTFFGQPYVIADRRFNGTSVQFEAWPYTTTQRTLHFYYYQLGADLVNDADLPLYPIRSDAIVSGALADLTRWPGTPDRPNPMFGKMDVYRSFELETEDKLVEVERADENLYLTWLNTQSFTAYPFVPLSANYVQSHAI